MTTWRPHLSFIGLIVPILLTPVFGGEPGSTPAIKEEELARVVRQYSLTIPWAKAAPSSKENAVHNADASITPNLTSGDLIIKAKGDLSREVKTVTANGVTEQKEVLTLNKDVEIEQISNKSVLRGQKVRITQDIKTGQTELLEANSQVELWTPDRCGRGESLLYECKPGVMDQYTIEGDHKAHTRATLWPGDDKVEADKFIIDERLGTFRALGTPIAFITMADTPSQSSAKPDTGGLPQGMKNIGHGKVRLRCDGEMNYESATGKIRATRNVSLFQESAGTTLDADEAVFTLTLPPPGQPPQPGGSMFTGELKTLECSGRAKLQTSDSTIFFDKGLLDMPSHEFLMEMKNPKDCVRIYRKEAEGGDSCMLSPKYFTINLQTNVFSGGGPMKKSAEAPPTDRTKP